MTDEAGSDTDAQVAEIEQGMRSDYREYLRNPGKQERYLELLKTREAAGEPEPREPSAVDTEIATIQERIRTDFRGYQGDPEMQARFTELLGEQQREHAKALAFAGKPDAPKRGHFHPAEASPFNDAVATGAGHATPRPTADIIAELQTEPATAALVASYGAQAPESIGDATQEATRILNAMSPEAAEAISAVYDGMSGAERARVLDQLADAGRARRTR